MFLRKASVSKIKRSKDYEAGYNLDQECRLALRQIQRADFISALNYLALEYRHCLACKEFIQEVANLYELEYDLSMPCQGWINHQYLLYYTVLQNTAKMECYLSQELMNNSVDTILSLAVKRETKLLFITTLCRLGLPPSDFVLRTAVELKAYDCFYELLKRTTVTTDLLNFVLESDDMEAITIICQHTKITSPKYIRSLLVNNKIELATILIKNDAEFDTLCVQLAKIKNYTVAYRLMMEKRNGDYTF